MSSDKHSEVNRHSKVNKVQDEVLEALNVRQGDGVLIPCEEEEAQQVTFELGVAANPVLGASVALMVGYTPDEDARRVLLTALSDAEVTPTTLMGALKLCFERLRKVDKTACARALVVLAQAMTAAAAHQLHRDAEPLTVNEQTFWLLRFLCLYTTNMATEFEGLKFAILELPGLQVEKLLNVRALMNLLHTVSTQYGIAADLNAEKPLCKVLPMHLKWLFVLIVMRAYGHVQMQGGTFLCERAETGGGFPTAFKEFKDRVAKLKNSAKMVKTVRALKKLPPMTTCKTWDKIRSERLNADNTFTKELKDRLTKCWPAAKIFAKEMAKTGVSDADEVLDTDSDDEERQDADKEERQDANAQQSSDSDSSSDSDKDDPKDPNEEGPKDPNQDGDDAEQASGTGEAVAATRPKRGRQDPSTPTTRVTRHRGGAAP